MINIRVTIEFIKIFNTRQKLFKYELWTSKCTPKYLERKQSKVKKQNI